MKKKTKIILIISFLTLGILAFILLLSGCKKKDNTIRVGEGLHLNSLNLATDAPDALVDESSETEGYKIANVFFLTPNVSKDKVVELLKDYMLYYNGYPHKANYELEVTFYDQRAKIKGKYPDGKVFSCDSPVYYVDTYEGIEYAAVTPYSFERYAIVCEKATIPSDFDINELAAQPNDERYYLFNRASFDLTYEHSLQTNNEYWSESWYRPGNGKYYNIMANVRIVNGLVDGMEDNDSITDTTVDNTSQEEASNTDNNSGENTNNPIEENSDVLNPIEKFYKDNIENNTIAKVTTIILSSVLGIGLVYVLFVIIRRIWKFIKG